MRAVFQILIGIVTHITVDATTTTASQTFGGCMWNRWSPNRSPSPRRSSSRPTGAASSTTSQSMRSRLTICQAWRCRSAKNMGEKRQIASLGQISRRPPPLNPHPTANGRAMNSPAMSAGAPTSTPTMAPA